MKKLTTIFALASVLTMGTASAFFINPMNAMQDVSDEMRNAVIEVTGDKPEEIIAGVLIEGGSVMPQEVTKELFMEMVQVTEVDEGITGPEVDESIKSMATNESILHVASFPW